MWASLLARHYPVLAFSRDPGRPAPAGVTRAGEEEVAGSDVLFLCVAISALEEVCERLAPRVAATTLVMDTCSVKVHPAAVMSRLFASPTPLLATHPMFGPDSIGGAVLPMVLCPVRASQDTVEDWRGRFERMGLQVLTMSADEHDRRAANTQGVTHLVGRILADLGLEATPLATLGYRRLLEIVEQTCNDTWQLFLDLQRYNPYTVDMRNRLRASIERVMRRLET
jgi:prephenate dehydrogenase